MPEPFKNAFSRPFVDSLAHALQQYYNDFPREAFLHAVFDDAWEARELKDRMRHITHSLRATLPHSYPQALEILRAAAPQSTLDGYGLAALVFPDFVEVYGLDHWDESLAALEQFTQQSSAEFAVRPFIVRDTPRMMAHMQAWTQHASPHLRRLASEGCRPRLPWAMALPAFKADPSPILPILEALKNDESEYVRRSVANNLNDIAKDNPQVTLEVLHTWNQHPTPPIESITRHALRTLIKSGDMQALSLLGYGRAKVTVQGLAVTPQQVMMGDELTFTCEVVALDDAPQAVEIDYVIHFARANGKSNAKVFKLTRKTLAPHECLSLRRRHSFRPITTRRYYAGEHALEIQVNGEVMARVTFSLVDQ